MWRISALLWSLVEWCEDRAALRRLRYCRKQRQREMALRALHRVTLNSKIRAFAAFVFVFIAGRR